MNYNANLTDKEECLITSVLSKGKTLKIAKMISKYYQSVKKFIVDVGLVFWRLSCQIVLYQKRSYKNLYQPTKLLGIMTVKKYWKLQEVGSSGKTRETNHRVLYKTLIRKIKWNRPQKTWRQICQLFFSQANAVNTQEDRWIE